MIRAIIELDLVYPYKISLSTLVEFCRLWDSIVLYGGSHRLKAIISMPSRHFRTIFGVNPQVKKYSVPSGVEKFIEALKVKVILVK